MAGKFIAVITTAPTMRCAREIARALVEKRLAACAQVSGPIESTYWWQGRVETAREWVCLAKTRAVLFGKAQRLISAMHPYDTPEIISLHIGRGSARYMNWLALETQTKRRAGA